MQKVKDVMTPHPQTCESQDSVLDALEIMKTVSCGAVPVVDRNNRVVNIITDRDIALCFLENPKAPAGNLKIQECIETERQMITIQPEDDIHRAIDLMEEHQVRRLPVCDAKGQCIGIIAQADIALKDQNRNDIAELMGELSEQRRSVGANP